MSDRRGQTDPLAALVAVLAVGLGLSLYAGALDDAAPTRTDRTAETTLSAVHDVVAPDGTAVPGRLGRAPAAGPDGWAVNVTLRTGAHTWTAGPEAPDGADGASRRVPVRRTVGVDPGRLTVVVWP